MNKIIQLAGWIFAALPVFLLRIIAVVGGDILYFLHWPIRRILFSNLQHVFPQKNLLWRRRKARESCRRLIEKFLFVLSRPHLDQGRLNRTLLLTNATVELLHKYLQPRRPLILLSLHTSLAEAFTLLRRVYPGKSPDIGLYYRHSEQAILDRYAAASRSAHGCVILSSEKGADSAKAHLKKNNWVALNFGRADLKEGQLGFFLGRIATINTLFQTLARACKSDVAIVYVERTGFWEGNLHIERVARGHRDEPILFKANEWLENRLKTDEKLVDDWMWMHDRWKTDKDHREILNLEHPKSIIEESRSYYGWPFIPKKNHYWLRMPSNLGNFVKMLPFIKQIGYSRPDAEITILIKRHFSVLVKSLSLAQRVVAIPRRNTAYFNRFYRMRTAHPDYYFPLTDTLLGDIEALLTGAPRRFGLRIPGSTRPLLTDKFPLDPGYDEAKNHQTHLWEMFFRYFGLRGDLDWSPLQLDVDNLVINPLRCLQTESREAPYLGLICGAGNQMEKCWSIDYWIECVAGLMDLYPQSNICLFGSSPDLQVSRKIIEEFEPGSIHDFTGSTDLLQFAIALKSCSIVISNDCGGLHLANALGIPVIGLYGETNPLRTGPIFEAPKKIVQPKGCPMTGGISVTRINLSQVFEAIADLLGKGGQARRGAPIRREKGTEA
ncbi:MAG: hypothetical protein F7B06_09910, partial [Opitutae bacterium]|nr:hypothetical protein [Opitutae bacterium]